MSHHENNKSGQKFSFRLIPIQSRILASYDAMDIFSRNIV